MTTPSQTKAKKSDSKSASHAAGLMDRLKKRTARVAVVGLGYVGMPLAAAFAEAGFEVLGIDVDERRAALLGRGESDIPDVPAARVAALVAARKFRATTDNAGISDCDAIVVCVPTPLRKNRDPDISYIVAAADGVARHARKGQLVVLESTTYPGTTRKSSSRASSRAASRSASRYSWHSPRSGSTREPHLRRSQHAESGRRHHPRVHEALGGALRGGRRHGRRGLES